MFQWFLLSSNIHRTFRKAWTPNICLSKQVSFTLFYMEQIDHLEHFDHQECPFKGHFWQKGAF